MSTSTYTLWSMWHWLSYLNRLFVLGLAAVTTYSVASAVIVIKGLWGLKKDRGRRSFERDLTALLGRCQSMRQVLSAAFYTFGVLIFWTLQNATIILGNRRAISVSETLNGFAFDFIYAANVFFVFLVLHLIQWVLWSRVQAYAIGKCTSPNHSEASW